MSDFNSLKLVDPSDAIVKAGRLEAAEETLGVLLKTVTEAVDIYDNMDGVGVLGTEVANTLRPCIEEIKKVQIAVEAIGANVKAATASAQAQLDAVN